MSKGFGINGINIPTAGRISSPYISASPGNGLANMNDTQLLAFIAAQMATLAERLAPDPIMLAIPFNNMANGEETGMQCPLKINGFIGSLSSGSVAVNFGSLTEITNEAPDLVFSSSQGGSVYIPITPQIIPNIRVVSTDLVNPAYGKIWVLCY